MPIPLSDLFDTENVDWGPRGSSAWNKAVFERAYCSVRDRSAGTRGPTFLAGGGEGPFDKVCARLRSDFSVLVYLPGNCMAAAAELVRDGRLGNAGDWSELGKPDKDRKTMSDIWRHSSTVLDRMLAWLTGGQSRPPKAIFHNLDLLGDGRGGLDPGNEAKTALLYLTDSVRCGVVLGLCDRDAGELPEAIGRVFAEKIWLDEVPLRNFPRLIPRRLGELIAEGDMIPDNAAWIIASRLRWTDPIRAVRIMEEVAKSVAGKDPDENLGKLLKGILDATKTVEFLNPADNEQLLDADSALDPRSGFDTDTTAALAENVIEPFKHWAGKVGQYGNWEGELRSLPTGLILCGPPGTGKTRLARWIARSISLPFRQVSAADLKRADWGLTERLVKDLFRSARRSAPCVIVLDDADDLLPERNSTQSSLASAESGIVNAFLQEMDGFEGKPVGVLVILTTNRYDHLDRAAKSRFPIHLHLHVPYPLDANQVGEIVDNVARFYGFGTLSPEVRNVLITQFMGTIKRESGQFSAPDIRRKKDSNLYSPRDIEASMRMLRKIGGGPPGIDDANRLIHYLQQ